MADKKRSAKRVQIDKAKSTLFAVIVIVSIVSVFSLMISKTLISQITFLNRVSTQKGIALQQLKDNKEAVTKLVSSYKKFAAQNPNLLGGNTTGDGSHDGDNGKLILDALPSKYDFPALTASLEKLLIGYKIGGITGTDDVVAQSSAVTGQEQPIDIPFKIDVAANYTDIQKLIGNLELSIRPFQILSLDLNGSNNDLQANIDAKTFYQPEKSLTVETKVVK